MLNDAVNYVRQGVLIASALICIQHTEATCPKVCLIQKEKRSGMYCCFLVYLG